MANNTPNETLDQAAEQLTDTELDNVAGGATTTSTKRLGCPYCSGEVAKTTITPGTIAKTPTYYCKNCGKRDIPQRELKEVVVTMTENGEFHTTTGSF